MHKHMIEEMARAGAHVDLWLFCPYHPDGIVESFARSSADRKPGAGDGARRRATRWASISPLLGRGRQRRATSGWPAPSVPARCTSGPVDLPRRRRPVVPRPRRRRRPHPRRPRARTIPSAAGRVPGQCLPRRRLVRPRTTPHELARALASVDVAAASTERRRSAHGRPRPGRRRSSPAATAGRPRSPTTSSATTSRACATARTCAPGSLSLSTNIELFSAIANDHRLRHGLRVPARVARPAR